MKSTIFMAGLAVVAFTLATVFSSFAMATPRTSANQREIVIFSGAASVLDFAVAQAKPKPKEDEEEEEEELGEDDC